MPFREYRAPSSEQLQSIADDVEAKHRVCRRPWRTESGLGFFCRTGNVAAVAPPRLVTCWIEITFHIITNQSGIY